MTHNNDLAQKRTNSIVNKLSQLSIGILLGMTTLSLTAQADTAGTEEYRAPTASIDSSEPIAALSTLTSLDDTTPLSVTVPTIQQFETEAGVPVRFCTNNCLANR